MKVTSLQIQDFRAFSELPETRLGQINLLIGPNNTGKSSILRALYGLQEGATGQFQDVRLGAQRATIKVGLDGPGVSGGWEVLNSGPGLLTLTINPSADRTGGSQTFNLQVGASQTGVAAISAKTPNHFIVPFLSRRKAVSYGEDVRQQFALEVGSNFQHLAAKLSRIANPTFSSYQDYSRACMEMLGFVVTAIPSQNGQRPGIYLPNQSTLFIDQLGEGVPNIVGMLVELTTSEGKLFLIEEPENDLHPSALKALLELIRIRSEFNQFVISTHSNIVLRHLGAHPDCKIFSISSVKDSVPPAARLNEVEKTAEARFAILESMGYGLSDFELWDGWLILEESSAERIIRDYFIPWFAPKLSRMRTMSARGVNQVEPLFNDYLRVVCFAHLEELYRTRTWVRIDGDAPGQKVVERLRTEFSGWEKTRFDCFSQDNFERFYPSVFSKEVAETLAIGDRQAKRVAKRELLGKVVSWLDEDHERGKQALSESAQEIVEFLRQIEIHF